MTKTGAPHLVGTQRNTFGTQSDLVVDGQHLRYHDITRMAPPTLPVSLRILLENVLRFDDGTGGVRNQIAAILDGADSPVDLYPSRVFLHDTNGVPTLVDIAAIRDGIAVLGGDPAAVNPVISSELVVDHSVIADVYGTPDALVRNVDLEYSRNGERYRFLRWGQQSLDGFAVVPPGTGIMHQVNLENLARVVMTEGDWVLPDVCLGTDSHTTMVNGLGVLGWGIGGIEAEAAMLGNQSRSTSHLSWGLPSRGTAGRFNGDRPRADDHRATSRAWRHRKVRRVRRSRRLQPAAGRPCNDREHEPEFGCRCALFRLTKRHCGTCGSPAVRSSHVKLVEAYAKAQGLWHDPQRGAEVRQHHRTRPW